MDLFRQTLKPVEQVLKDANVKKEDVDEVVLVSGLTRIPKIQQLLKDYWSSSTSTSAQYISERMQLLTSLFSYSSIFAYAVCTFFTESTEWA